MDNWTLLESFLQYWHFRAAPLVTCRLELRQLLASWEAELGRHAPALAVLHVPRLWAADSAPDIAALFPARTAVVTCMESLLGAQTSLGRTELQALLFSDDLRFRYLYNLSYIPFICLLSQICVLSERMFP